MKETGETWAFVFHVHFRNFQLFHLLLEGNGSKLFSPKVFTVCLGIRAPFHDLEDMKLGKINTVSSEETTAVHQAAPCHPVKMHS